LTPIRHSFHFRPFVYNELERNYENDTDLDYNQLKHIHCYDISLITKKLTKIKEKEKEGENCDLIEKIDFNIENAILMAKKCKIIGYLSLLTIEKSLMNSSSDSLTDSFRFNDKSLKHRNKYLKQFIDETDSEVTNTDITRLLIIYRLLKQEVKTEHIKDILNQKQKQRQIDYTLIEDFVNLTKEVQKLNSFSRNRSFKAIIKDFDGNGLSEELFPKIYGKEIPKSKERKLFLFILGGLSYNDLISISDQYQNEVLFCSDVLITPRMLLNSILFEESND
jgi:transcriptional regulator with PAS, ATPase and Fis domain